MRIYEYEGKEILKQAGLPTPRGGLAQTPAEAADIAADLGGPVFIKAQTLIKARGLAGLVAEAKDPAQASEIAERLLGQVHQGEKVTLLLVEEKLALQEELYAGIIVDYTRGAPLMLVSRQGGQDIEATARQNPELIQKVSISPQAGLSEDQAGELALALGGSDGKVSSQALQKFLLDLYGVFRDTDCEMAEINPLALTPGGELVALDAALILDEEALFRHPELVRPRGQSPEEFEHQVDFRKRGWSYLQLEGDIGILSSGAGITMAILDLMRARGGKPANFLDTAQMNRQGIYDAFQIFLGDPGIKTVLVNIFAGLNRCDDLALGIRDFIKEHSPEFQLVVRMVGNREEEGRRILAEVGITIIAGLEAAVDQALAVTEAIK